AVNVATDGAEMKEALVAEALELDLSGYDALELDDSGDEGTGDRQVAVATDVLANKGNGFDLERLKRVFDAAVVNRTATREALKHVNTAAAPEDLRVEAFIGSVMETYDTNKGVLPNVTGYVTEEVIAGLTQDMADFEALSPSSKTAVRVVLHQEENYPSWSAMYATFKSELVKAQDLEQLVVQ
uniref:hypothetical protein n=1 Tax=Exiguobacterium flavidum TaxID=2184695 RepID=UPI0013008BBB